MECTVTPREEGARPSLALEVIGALALPPNSWPMRDDDRGMTPRTLTAHDRRRLAVAACADTETVRRWEFGLPIRSTSRARIEAASAALGFNDDAGHTEPKNSA